MTDLTSPLRYPGGKSFLWEFFSLLIQDAFRGDVVFAEPYAGGAGAALKLLGQGYVTDIEINDASYEVFAFWNSVINYPEELCRRIRDCRVTMAAYRRHKATLANQEDCSMVDVGFAAFFLNRTNRSGILSGGPIGGYAQSGQWTLDARFSRTTLIERIREIADFGPRIRVSNVDALTFLRMLDARRGKEKRNILAYLDPPYFLNGRRLYLDYYVRRDHENLATYLATETSLDWVLTYDDVPEIRSLYQDRRKNRLSIGHSANGAAVGNELLVTCKRLETFSSWRRFLGSPATKRLRKRPPSSTRATAA